MQNEARRHVRQASFLEDSMANFIEIDAETVDPEFGAQPYLLAWDVDGQTLTGEQSPAVLVASGDRTEGRYIHGLVSIEVRSV